MRLSRSVVAVALLLFTGCGGRLMSDLDSGVSDGGVDSAVDSGGCGAGLAACGSTCVDPSKDPKNCGTCGHACAPSQVCMNGACSIDCVSPQTKCGQSCVSTATDPANCGGCNKACANGLSCVASQCTLICKAGQTQCSNKCVDTQIDNANCGSCGATCDADGGPGCVSGLCCGPGKVNCGGTCTDNLTDPKNCGPCNNVCPPQTPSCAGGKCTSLQVLGTLGSQTFYKIPVTGAMTDTNVYAACVAAGLTVGCSSTNCPTYTDNVCTPTLENSCGNPMKSLATVLGCASPSNCAQLNGVYQYMGHKWQSDASCGVEGAQWCSTGTSYSNRWALCLQ
jgi:hypothetical protein